MRRSFSNVVARDGECAHCWTLPILGAPSCHPGSEAKSASFFGWGGTVTPSDLPHPGQTKARMGHPGLRSLRCPHFVRVPRSSRLFAGAGLAIDNQSRRHVHELVGDAFH